MRLTSIQNLPLRKRIRILWITLGVAAIAILAIWYFSLSGSVNLMGGEKQNENISRPVGNKYVKVDWAQKLDGNLEVYFKVKNDTQNILNFSNKDQVTLKYDDTRSQASKIEDRQGQEFVKKVLSNTEVYGKVVFPDVGDTKKLVLDFDNLFFETDPNNSFIEEVTIDLSTLQEPLEIRE
ncbi:MAG: hypothetical protein ACM3KM_00020 [Acidobacteriaceae bacterium]